LISPGKKEHKLNTYENRALRRIFGSKREEVIGGDRKWYNEELHNLNIFNIISLIKIRRWR
jgi:PAS domain-containing protein